MKLTRSSWDWTTAGRKAFSLVEMMISISIFITAVAALLGAWLFAMKQDQLVNSRIGATDQARNSMGNLTRDIRCAKMWSIGTFPNGGSSASAFTAIPDGQTRRGNAVALWLDASQTNAYWLYYFSSNAGEFYRMHSTDNSKTRLAQYLTNTMYFQAENASGQVLTNSNFEETIDCCMEFFQYQYPLTKIGSNYLYTSYRLEFRITPHAPE